MNVGMHVTGPSFFTSFVYTRNWLPTLDENFLPKSSSDAWVLFQQFIVDYSLEFLYSPDFRTFCFAFLGDFRAFLNCVLPDFRTF